MTLDIDVLMTSAGSYGLTSQVFLEDFFIDFDGLMVEVLAGHGFGGGPSMLFGWKVLLRRSVVLSGMLFRGEEEWTGT